jgi:cyclopropane fatty-acyl-phospholipid synthase-like methyltransferase
MIKNRWDAIYKLYKLNHIPWHSGQPDRYLSRLVREGKIRKGRALDMCMGDGTNSLYLASRGFQVVGVDISKKAVEIAKERCNRRKLTCDFRIGNVLKLDFEEKFDFIFDRGCFHHIAKKQKPKYAELVHSLLRSKGQLYLMCFSDRNPPHKKNISKKDIRGYFDSHFDIISIRDSVHREPPHGWKRYLYAVFMQRRD